jgi:hypothetical protein
MIRFLPRKSSPGLALLLELNSLLAPASSFDLKYGDPFGWAPYTRLSYNF